MWVPQGFTQTQVGDNFLFYSSGGENISLLYDTVEIQVETNSDGWAAIENPASLQFLINKGYLMNPTTLTIPGGTEFDFDKINDITYVGQGQDNNETLLEVYNSTDGSVFLVSAVLSDTTPITVVMKDGVIVDFELQGASGQSGHDVVQQKSLDDDTYKTVIRPTSTAEVDKLSYFIEPVTTNTPLHVRSEYYKGGDGGVMKRTFTTSGVTEWVVSVGKAARSEAGSFDKCLGGGKTTVNDGTADIVTAAGGGGAAHATVLETNSNYTTTSTKKDCLVLIAGAAGGGNEGKGFFYDLGGSFFYGYPQSRINTNRVMILNPTTTVSDNSFNYLSFPESEYGLGPESQLNGPSNIREVENSVFRVKSELNFMPGGGGGEGAPDGADGLSNWPTSGENGTSSELVTGSDDSTTVFFSYSREHFTENSSDGYDSYTPNHGGFVINIISSS